MDQLQRMLASVPPPGPRSLGCANCCVVFASSGVVFLCFIGTLLKSKQQQIYIIGVDKPEAAARSCFSAAAIYLAIVVFSILVLLFDRFHSSNPHSGTAPWTTAPHYGSTSHLE